MSTDATELDFLIGYVGKDILRAIYNGCKTADTIFWFSGCPVNCVKGRLPVLMNLDLITGVEGEYILTEFGENFLTQLQTQQL